MHPDKFLGRATAGQAPAISQEDREAQLEALSTSIVGKRKEAIDARKESGIEDVWLACEDAYLGIDDMNRAEFAGAKWAKPTSINGGLVSSSSRSNDARSSAFVRLTSRYVDGASAKLAEIILPIDEKAFKFKPTPVPEMVQEVMGQPPQQPPADPMAAMQQPQPGQPPMQGGAQAPMPVDPKIAEQKRASKASDAAEQRIYDWMTEANYPAEARKVIKDCARIGAGVLKGPFPEERKNKAMVQQGDVMAMEIKKSIAPSLKWVDTWNFYPAAGCGEDIHDGDHCFEKDYYSEWKLKSLREETGYLKEAIDRVIDEGPGKINLDASRNEAKHNTRARYEVWYFYGCITRDDLQVTEAVGIEDFAQEQKDIPVILTMVNDTIIRALINPMDSGSFPYHVVCWSRRPGHWAGVGVGEKMEMPQRSVNAATRSLFNNAGISSGAQFVIDQLGIVPADGSWTITPNKVWYKTGESTAQNVRDAFQVVLIPSMQRELSAIIEYGMRLAEESTSIPLITQGQSGPTTPQTFGQAELQNNNALTWLRSIGYQYDDQITAPLVDAFYEWLLLDPKVPANEKGDFSIDAHGSSAMVERAIQEQTMVGLLQMSGNPMFEIDPAKLFVEYLKTKRMNPDRIMLDEEGKAKRAQMQPPEAPQVQVAKIRAQTDMEKTKMAIGADVQVAQMDNATQVERVRVDTDRDTLMVNAQANRDQIQGNLAVQKLALQRELAMLQYANDQKLSLEAVKSQLAQTAMKEQTKKELAAAQIALNQSEGHQNRVAEFAKGPLEPIGRAEDGKAFSQ